MIKHNYTYLGPWKATITVHSDRRNLFELHSNHEFHIGTIVSGSKSEIPRFNYYVSLIEKAPEMRKILIEVFDRITTDPTLNHTTFHKIASDIVQCLNDEIQP